MAKLKMTLIVLCILCHLSVVLTTNPGFKARITQNGLTYANNVAIGTLSQQIKNLKIPDQSGKSHDFTYSLSNIKITDFPTPTSSMTLRQGAGILWAASRLSMSLEADWRFKYRKAFIHISDHGSLDASVSGLQFTITVLLDDSQGRPQLKESGCSSDISDVHVKFHGGASWLYNLFAGIVESKVKDLLKSKMCDLIEGAITNDANKQLSKLPMSVVLDSRFQLDYSLLSNPVFGTKYMETMHKGEIFWKGGTETCPFSPSPLPDTSDVSRMLYLWVSEYMGNSLAYSGFNHGFLKYNLTAKDLPPDDRYFLNTSCTLKCIGTVIPQIRKMYPNSKVMLGMHATATPQIKINPGVVNMNFSGNVDLYAQTPKGQTVFLLTIKTVFVAAVEARIEGQLLKGEIKDTKLNLNVINSKVGPVSQIMLQFVMDTALKMFIVPQLNAEGEKGLVLPVTDDIHFDKAQLTLLQGAILISTDLLYKPTTEDAKTFDQKEIFHNFPDKRVNPDMSFQVIGARNRNKMNIQL